MQFINIMKIFLAVKLGRFFYIFFNENAPASQLRHSNIHIKQIVKKYLT